MKVMVMMEMVGRMMTLEVVVLVLMMEMKQVSWTPGNIGSWNYSAIHYTTVYYSVLQCTTVYYSVLQCTTMYFNV